MEPEATFTEYKKLFRPPRLVPRGDGWVDIVADERVPRPRSPAAPPPGAARWLSVEVIGEATPDIARTFWQALGTLAAELLLADEDPGMGGSLWEAA